MDNQLKDFISKCANLLELSEGITPQEASKRAAKFLAAHAVLNEYKRQYKQEQIKATSLERAVYAQGMANDTAKNVTEKKAFAEASGSYIEARENLEAIQAELSYLQTYMDIFQNAHVFYRKLSNEEVL